LLDDGICSHTHAALNSTATVIVLNFHLWNIVIEALQPNSFLDSGLFLPCVVAKMKQQRSLISELAQRRLNLSAIRNPHFEILIARYFSFDE